MLKAQDNILKFNLHVKHYIYPLKERGETSNDLLVNMSKGYLSCHDKTFNKHMQQIINRDEDESLGKLTLDTLMLKGANTHKSLKQTGKWKEPNKVKHELMAMSTEIAKLKKESSHKKED